MNNGKTLFRQALTLLALIGIFAGTTATAQESKIGVVRVAALLERAPQALRAMEALDEEFQPRQREIVAKQQEYQERSEQIQKDLAVMGETERRNAEKEVRDMQRELTRLQNEFREDLNLRRNEELGMLQRSLLTEIQDYAKRSGYDMVVGEGVLYASEAMDITENILRSMEANFNE